MHPNSIHTVCMYTIHNMFICINMCPNSFVSKRHACHPQQTHTHQHMHANSYIHLLALCQEVVLRKCGTHTSAPVYLQALYVMCAPTRKHFDDCGFQRRSERESAHVLGVCSGGVEWAGYGGWCLNALKRRRHLFGALLCRSERMPTRWGFNEITATLIHAFT